MTVATKEELSRYLCEHYAYELQMLRHTLTRLKVTTDQLDWNAYFESCALHARALRDFYTNDPESRSYKAKDFGVASLSDRKTFCAEFDRINPQIAHLGKKRVFGTEDGKFTFERLAKIVAWLEALHKEFVASCDPASKDGWQESLAQPPLTLQPGNASLMATNQINVAASQFGATLPAAPAGQGGSK